MKETPLAELFVDGMSDEQVWAELELRAQNVCDVLDYALDGPTPGDESGEEGGSMDDEEEERELKKMRQALIDEGFDPEELEGMGFEDDEGEDEQDEDNSEEDEDEEDEDESEDEEAGEEGDLGEEVEELRDPSDEDEDEDDLESEEPSFLSAGKRTLKAKPKRSRHPVLDDGFFDLADFNAEIEAAESKNVSRGRLSKDDEDEDEDEDIDSVDYFASVDDTEAFDEEDLDNGGGTFHFYLGIGFCSLTVL